MYTGMQSYAGNSHGLLNGMLFNFHYLA
jgi:hypothetical protein